MHVIVVRHAHAVSRATWEGEEPDRPLSARGAEEARRLVARLVELKPARILSSPAARCTGTVRPLSVACDLAVESDPRLAEGSGRAALELLRAAVRTGDNTVVCSHGDVIPEVLAAVAHEDGVDLGPAPRVEKASTWVLEGGGGRFRAATYIKPPKN